MCIYIWIYITPVQERDEGQPTLALRTAPCHRGGQRACGYMQLYEADHVGTRPFV